MTRMKTLRLLLSAGGFVTFLLGALRLVRLAATKYAGLGTLSDCLDDGWFGTTVDASDETWHKFRASIVLLTVLFSSFVLIGRVLQYIFGSLARKLFMLLFAFVYLWSMHGAGVVWPVFYVALHFVLVKWVDSIGAFYHKPLEWRRRLSLILSWIFGVAAMVYRVMPQWTILRWGWFGRRLAFLDEYPKILGWEECLWYTMLKCVSFAWDYWEMRKSEKVNREKIDDDFSSCVSESSEDCSEDVKRPGDAKMEVGEDLSLKERERTSLPASEYNLLTFVNYCLYPPLYIGGPVMTFNGFASSFVRPLGSSVKRFWLIIRLFFRVVVAIAFTEALVRFLYPGAVIFNFFEMPDRTPLLGAAVFYFYCWFIYFRLSAMWKFFALVAYLDGFDPLINLPTCLHGVFTVSEFWGKGWHQSYHHWLVRYIYIPVGGNKNRLLSVAIVFMFVGAWHDALILNYWMWSAAFAVVIVIEGLSSRWIQKAPLPPNVRWFLSLLGCSISLTFAVALNVHGFSYSQIRTHAGSSMVWLIAGDWRTVALTVSFFFCSLSILDWIRERQKLKMS